MDLVKHSFHILITIESLRNFSKYTRDVLMHFKQRSGNIFITFRQIKGSESL